MRVKFLAQGNNREPVIGLYTFYSYKCNLDTSFNFNHWFI